MSAPKQPLKDMQRMVTNKKGETTSIAWTFSDGELQVVSIVPHDRSKQTRAIFFRNGRRYFEVNQ